MPLSRLANGADGRSRVARKQSFTSAPRLAPDRVLSYSESGRRSGPAKGWAWSGSGGRFSAIMATGFWPGRSGAIAPRSLRVRLIDYFDASAERYPSKTAFIQPDGARLTYAEVEQQS